MISLLLEKNICIRCSRDSRFEVSIGRTKEVGLRITWKYICFTAYQL